MLDIIVSQPCSFANVKFSDSDKELIQQARDKGQSPIIIYYFHGKLESSVGYDIGVCLNGEEVLEGCDGVRKGIYDCSIRGYNGKCKAYIWKSKYEMGPRGLIVDVEDTDSVKYAEEMYAKEEEDL